MTAKEKALELVTKYRELATTIGVSAEGIVSKTEQAKKCAIIAVDEILSLRMIQNMGRGFDDKLSEGEYWIEVKKELKKL